MASQRTSPWIACGCGCVGCVGLIILGTLAAGFLGVSSFQGYLEDMSDPSARNDRAREILGAETLPEGYTAQLYLRLPWLFEIVFLTDGEPLEKLPNDDLDLTDEQLGEHIFAYISVLGDAEEIDPFDEDHSGPVNVEAGVRVRPLEDLAEGEIEISGGLVRYRSHRGELITDAHEVYAGLYSLLKVDCGNLDRRSRFGLWFYRTEATDDISGTPADSQALARFLGHFELCR